MLIRNLVFYLLKFNYDIKNKNSIAKISKYVYLKLFTINMNINIEDQNAKSIKITKIS